MNKKHDDIINKKAESSGTQSRYIDASGTEFSAQEIINGYKPKKPYKLCSLSERVNNPNFGKVKENK